MGHYAINSSFESRDVQIADLVVLKIRWVEDEDADLSYLETTEEEHYRSLLNFPRPNGKGTYSPRWARRLARQYVRQDTERMESYGQSWNMLGCVVELHVGGVKIDSASLWSIESDSDPEYAREVEEDLTNEVLIAANLEKTIAAYKQLIERLEKLTADLPDLKIAELLSQE